MYKYSVRKVYYPNIKHFILNFYLFRNYSPIKFNYLQKCLLFKWILCEINLYLSVRYVYKV
jgi:hypothetical protein